VEALTPIERAALGNGCGSDGGSSPARFLIRQFRFGPRGQSVFKEECNWHDIAAHIGGTCDHQDWAAETFLKRCMSKAVDLKEWKLLFEALAGYFAIELGYKYFSVGWVTRDQPCRFEEVKDIAKTAMRSKAWSN
jgi:hypothetical protein